jgi:hypothetical protein
MTRNQPNNNDHQYHTTVNDDTYSEQEYRQYYQHQYQLPNSDSDQTHNTVPNQSTYVK